MHEIWRMWHCSKGKGIEDQVEPNSATVQALEWFENNRIGLVWEKCEFQMYTVYCTVYWEIFAPVLFSPFLPYYPRANLKLG